MTDGWVPATSLVRLANFAALREPSRDSVRWYGHGRIVRPSSHVVRCSSYCTWCSLGRLYGIHKLGFSICFLV